MTQQYGSAGASAARWAIEDSEGLIAGFTGVLTKGTFAGMRDMAGFNALALSQPDPPRVPINAKDDVPFTFIFRATESPSGTLTLTINDLNLQAYPTGNVIVTNENNQEGVLIDPNVLDHKDIWIVAMSEAKSADSANYGASGYEVEYFRANLIPQGRTDRSFQTAGQWTWSIVANRASYTILGESYVPATHIAGTAIGKRSFYNNKVSFGRITGNASATGFTLDVPPALDDSGDPIADIWHNDGGVLTLLTAVAAAPADETEYTISEAGVVVFGAAIPDDDNYVVRWEYV